MTSTIPAESPTTTPDKQVPSKKRITSTKTAKAALALAGDIASALKTEPVTLPEPTGRQILRLPLTAVIASPDNPRQDVEEDVDGLSASMRASGLLQPVLVVPAPLYRAGNNQMPDASDDGRFVLIAGHRRTFAARSLGWTHIDAIVDDLVGVEARRAMIIENFQRVDLTAIEEARAFTDLLELGMSQEDLGEQVGCSQSHVSKRLSLLKLDVKVQAAVEANELGIGDALELSKLEETGRQVAAMKAMKEDQARGLRVDAKAAVERQQKQKKADEARAKSREVLKQKKIAEAQNLQDLFGYSSWQYELTAAEVTKHTKADLKCVVAKIGDWDGKLTYYCSEKKRCAAFPKAKPNPISSYENDRKQDERDRKTAMKKRREAAARLALHPAGRDTMQQFLLEQFVGEGLLNDASVATLASKWFAGHGHNGIGDLYHQTVRDILARDDAQRLLQQYAYARRIAALETAASSTYSGWNRKVADYLHELVTRVGYEPTPWELRKLGKVRGIKDPAAFLLIGEYVDTEGGDA